MTYKEALKSTRQGLIKQAAPRWVKEVLRLANKGQKESAGNLLSKMLVHRLYPGKIADQHFLHPMVIHGIDRISPQRLLRDRNLALVDRFINWKPANRFKKAFRAFNASDLLTKLNREVSVDTLTRRSGNKRYLEWFDTQLPRLGLQRDALGVTNNVKLLKFLGDKKANSDFKWSQYISALENNRLFKYLRPLKHGDKGFHMRNRLTSHLRLAPSKAYINKKAPPIAIDDLSQYIFGAKNLKSFKTNFEADQPIFMSGLYEVAKRYRDGLSRGGGSTILGIPRSKLKALLFSPHLSQINDNTRKKILKDFVPGTASQFVHNPHLDINMHPYYQTLLRKSQNPQALQHTLAIQKLPTGKYIGRPIEWDKTFPLSKLRAAVQQGRVSLPEGFQDILSAFD